MATLAALRTRLNNEVGVLNDTTDTVWSQAVRNQAIGDAYAELWRVGVWKDAKQDFATVTDQWTYALTSIRKLDRLEVLDSTSRVLERPRGVIEQDGSGTNAFQLRLSGPIASGYTLRVRGWAAYVSTFANDAAVDDLPAEHVRVPILKAKAILYRIQMGTFARYGERQALPPEMNVSVDQLAGIIQAAEREFLDAAKALAGLRTRTGSPRSI